MHRAKTIVATLAISAVLTLGLSGLTATPAAAAAIRSVAPSGSDTGDCIASPCHTIQYAVNQAAAGDTVMVATGTYAESVTVAKRLSLVGSGATIDATGHDNGVLITGPASAGTVLRSFTIENALLEGVLAFHTTLLTIADNSILNNNKLWDPINVPLPCQKSDDCGEGLHLWSVTNSVLSGNLVEGNVGGILLTDDNFGPGGPIIPPPGPTSGNRIENNRVLNNVKDCGITLASHYFSFSGSAPAASGGVYGNTISHNTSNGNGAAGIGIFAGPPGAAAYGNVVVGNTAMNNGLPGVAIHSHSPFQYVNDNVIANTTLTGNGADDDAATGASAGIVVFSGVIPIQHTVISANRINDEHFGIFTKNAVVLSGLPSNKFESVDIPTSIN
jgi:hypothetical protein